MNKRAPLADPVAVAAYIDAAPAPARARLRVLRKVIRDEAPDAIERIAYGLATWHRGENLIHVGAFTHHIGVYPGAAAVAAFATDLAAFKTSKGAIQVPHDAPLPTALVRRLTRWRLAQVTQKQAAGEPNRRPSLQTRGRVSAPRSTSVHADIVRYNAAQKITKRATCEALVTHIAKALPKAENKVWHGHPVWFLDGNPVVGYSTHKGCVRLLLWSGQSFEEPALVPVGKFKAAEARYSSIEDVDAKAMRRWLKKAKSIQWDYKNLAKSKGALARLR